MQITTNLNNHWYSSSIDKAPMLMGIVLATTLFCVNARADVISYDTGVLGTSYSGGWGKYFAVRFTNELGVPFNIEAVLIRRTPFGGAADVYLWADAAGAPGALLAGPVYSSISDTWARIDVAAFGLSIPPGGSIFAGFDPRGTAQVPYDGASPGVGRSWWRKSDLTEWVQGGPLGENSNLMVRLEVTPQSVTIPVTIDIKPGSWPNAINLGSKGVIPVAILSSEDFEATTVDPSTVLLGGVDVAMRGKGSKLMAHFEDVDGDGLTDLVVQVETEAAGLWTSGTVILMATTYGGQDIIGFDEVVIVPSEE